MPEEGTWNNTLGCGWKATAKTRPTLHRGSDFVDPTCPRGQVALHAAGSWGPQHTPGVLVDCQMFRPRMRPTRTSCHSSTFFRRVLSSNWCGMLISIVEPPPEVAGYQEIEYMTLKCDNFIILSFWFILMLFFDNCDHYGLYNYFLFSCQDAL